MTDRPERDFDSAFDASSLNEPGVRSMRDRTPADVRRWLEQKAATAQGGRDIEGEDGPTGHGDGLLDDRALIKLLGGRVAAGDTVAAARDLIAPLADPGQIDRVIEKWRQEVQAPRELVDPFTMTDPDTLPDAWYRGPQDGEDRFWPLAVDSMRRAGLEQPDIDAVDRATSRILSLTQPPGGGAVDSRGLVLGHVQSGKTTNFTGLIAKAADVGYRMVIVLTGVAENLRVQTQWRLNEALVAPAPNDWFETTSVLSDFAATANAGYVLSRPDGLALAVVKKNVFRLNRLNRWLDQAGEVHLRSCPILVIDDEADQASLDISTRPDYPSRINEQIRRLLDRPKTTYVAYTATPFANLLIDPKDNEDLYPRDFIVDLPKPRKGSGYLGTEEVFGRLELVTDEGDGDSDGLDMVRQIPDDEAASLRPPRNADARHAWKPLVPPGMGQALRWFLLATAARRVRDGRWRHSSMLIHTTQYTDAQLRMRPEVETELQDLARRLVAGDSDLLTELEAQWSAESERVRASEFELREIDFPELLPELYATAAAAAVYVDNYRSEDRIVYGDEPLTAVVIGGNTLSRGLTLEGLVSSYFVRTSRAYDTLLQMGRWFGFRKGWQDLPRIWMTGELWNWFTWLATVEEEVRRDVRRYEHERLTPLQFSVRIAKHPDFAVTSALKMRSAVPAHVSYAQTRQQTILFNHKDGNWLRRNLEATRTLLSEAAEARGVEWMEGRALLRDVPAADLIAFFESYQFHENAMQLRSDLVSRYIRSQNDHSHLTLWNIVVAGVPDPGETGVELGLGRTVGRIVRSRLDIEDLEYANIKTLMSRRDWLADHPDLYQNDLDVEAIWQTRDQYAPDRGLLVVYPIDPRSPHQRGKDRTELGAVEEVVGLGVLFPPTDTMLDVDYVTARLEPGELEEPDDLEVLTEEVS
jgi:hypothetical protein